ncbi:MAG: zinc-binding dehydrogenase [Myxococcales bacterium]|nr:zinc-binding dehydrogenase [Myxococcales bacterium]
MRQIVIAKAGAPEVLKLREVADPEPGPGEVRIRVRASGVNFADIMARLGLYPDAPPLPCVVGYEVAGVIDALGDGVEGLEVGARVLAMTRFGGYSEAVVVPAAQALLLPEGLSFEKAAAIPVNYLTAWMMLVRIAGVRPGERVLVQAVAGGVGQAALQICRWRGAEVIGTASAGKHARLRELGVSHCIDYRSVDFERAVKEITGGRGVDIALDGVGGASLRKSYRCLAPMGRLFAYGASSLAPQTKRKLIPALRGLLSMPRFGAVELMNDNRGVYGVNMGHLWEEVAALTAMTEAILAAVVAGDLDPVVDRVFAFEEAAAAHAYIQERRNFGKVVLAPAL